MLNIMSYVGMNMQAELSLWTLLGILRTIFDATLFKVNANLKQVWQMSMPAELSMPVQRVLRTMISGIMLVQCFTVYVYLATYIVLLYPVFLEERPTLVLPWLLLAAVRQLLCELLSLALGLGACLLVGPARPPCIKFVVTKVASIMPSFYMWTLVFSYYHSLKLAAVFKTFPAAPAHDMDDGLELAIRRRRTKSLFNKNLLRTRLITNLYAENQVNTAAKTIDVQDNVDDISPSEVSEIQSNEGGENVRNKTGSDRNQNTYDLSEDSETLPHRLPSDIRTSEDWYGNEITVPRDSDRITEQFGVMLLRLAAYLKRSEYNQSKIFESSSVLHMSKSIGNNLNCQTLTADATDTPPLTASSKGNIASYLREYPQIFMKKTSDLQSQLKLDTIRTVQSEGLSSESTTMFQRQIISTASDETHKLNNKSQRKRVIAAEEDDLKQQTGYKFNYSKQLRLSREVNANQDWNVSNVTPQNNDEKLPNRDMVTSSSDSMKSIIIKMKSQLKEARSRYANAGKPPSSSHIEPHLKGTSNDNK